jgi:hypothetical protein
MDSYCRLCRLGRIKKLYSTISNVENLLGVHEYLGHYKYNINSHKDIFMLQRKHPSWSKTTEHFKNYETHLFGGL